MSFPKVTLQERIALIKDGLCAHDEYVFSLIHQFVSLPVPAYFRGAEEALARVEYLLDMPHEEAAKMTYDISYVGQGNQQMIDRGYAADVVHSLRLSFQYTQEEQERNRLMFETTPQDGRQMDYGKAAMQKSMEIYPVMEAIAQEFVCYQFDPASGVPYSSDQWELFFWCNDFYNTAQGSSLSGRDYSYITLSFNEDYHTVEKRREICDRVLAFLQEKFGDHPHLDVAVQHGIWMDTEKIRRDAKNLLPYLMGPCVYEGQEGKIIWTANGPVFMKKRARRYGYRLGDVDILRIAWKRGLSADAAPETEHDTAPCLAAQ